MVAFQCGCLLWEVIDIQIEVVHAEWGPDRVFDGVFNFFQPAREKTVDPLKLQLRPVQQPIGFWTIGNRLVDGLRWIRVGVTACSTRVALLSFLLKPKWIKFYFCLPQVPVFNLCLCLKTQCNLVCTFFFCLCRALFAALALLTGLGSELLMKSSSSSTSRLSMALATVSSESWRWGSSSLRLVRRDRSFSRISV